MTPVSGHHFLGKLGFEEEKRISAVSVMVMQTFCLCFKERCLPGISTVEKVV